MDRNLSLLSVDLFLDNFVDVDAETTSVNRHHLTLTLLVVTTENFDGVSLAHGDGANLVLGAEVLGQMGRKKLSTEAGGAGKVGLSGLASLARYT